MHPILFVDLFKQSSYKTTILLSVLYKQLTYFSKKYSKSTRITLCKTNKLSVICEKDNVKAIKYINRKTYAKYSNILVFMCSKSDNVRTIRYFLNYGYDVSTNACINKTYYSLRQFGAKYGCAKIVKLLLDYGCPGNFEYLECFQKCCCYNNSSLFESVYNGHKEVVKLLLDNNKCNIHVYYNVLQLSKEKGNIDIMNLLLKYNANIRVHV